MMNRLHSIVQYLAVKYRLIKTYLPQDITTYLNIYNIIFNLIYKIIIMYFIEYLNIFL